MKKILLTLLVATATVALVACGGSDKGDSSKDEGSNGGNSTQETTINEGDKNKNEIKAVVEAYLEAVKVKDYEKANDAWYICRLSEEMRLYALDELQVSEKFAGIFYNTRTEMYDYTIKSVGFNNDVIPFTHASIDKKHEEYVRPNLFGWAILEVGDLELLIRTVYDRDKWVIFESGYNNDYEKIIKEYYKRNDTIFGDASGEIMPDNYITEIMNKELAENKYVEKDGVVGEIKDKGDFTVVAPKGWRVTEQDNLISFSYGETGISIEEAYCLGAGEGNKIVGGLNSAEEYMNAWLESAASWGNVNVKSGRIIGINEEFVGFTMEWKMESSSSRTLHLYTFVETGDKIYMVCISGARSSMSDYIKALDVLGTVDVK